MIAYFLEQYIDFLNLVLNRKVVVLTPDACFFLDRVKASYEIPEDYVYPKRLLQKEREAEIKKNKWANVFIESRLQGLESEEFWQRFISEYLKRNKDVMEIGYLGDQIERLIKVLTINCNLVYHDKEQSERIFRIRN